ncbi:cell envelope biogenesis protein OmpA [Nocardia sp. XZ_19_385]|uniref:cell envelope biogenesis protein OmpA n=1 Tax=Nocardia sp. XZ_19_385 TaxID=2769488 RepID=UPI00188F19E0|nr:cell envelope biogenesis protein OmpA [Nocardia sp. XZ_19_385]
MVVPFITLAHTDRTRPIWGKLDPARVQPAFEDKLCQICGERLSDPFVVYIRPDDFQRGLAVEAGLHPECGLYSKQACPMLVGAMARYNPNPLKHFRHCADPACGCGRWSVPEPDPREGDREGTPADTWYEAWISLADYRIVNDPGNERYAPAVGISLRPPTRIRRLRKIRDAAPNTEIDQPADLLAAVNAVRKLFGIDNVSS